MNIEYVLNLLREDTDFQDFLKDPEDVEKQRKAVEAMYTYVSYKAFRDGRESMKKEWKVYSDNQKKQIEAMNKIAKILNVKIE